ncbi:hypothetical protein HYC85_023892 [Camellia sinensis]|uniref:Uncharacterized protein n=1 Tax=Camellia sinensis TaxID=4442 RepID=A0A7J7GFS7_CAMSI|nr:hypothetical protein HYC85_023892 [Camellia sinensis]
MTQIPNYNSMELVLHTLFPTSTHTRDPIDEMGINFPEKIMRKLVNPKKGRYQCPESLDTTEGLLEWFEKPRHDEKAFLKMFLRTWPRMGIHRGAVGGGSSTAAPPESRRGNLSGGGGVGVV